MENLNLCPGCQLPILVDERKFMQAIDRPKYQNIWWHRDCWDNVVTKLVRRIIVTKETYEGM